MMSGSKDPSCPLDDDELYCQEENWEEEDGVSCYNGNHNIDNHDNDDNNNNYGIDILVVNGKNSEKGLCFDENEEFFSLLLSKEGGNGIHKTLKSDQYLAKARRDAVGWMLKVHAHYSFSLQTALLAVNYFDRFIFRFEFQREKKWMTQLAAVACLSVAAKVEETHVPLLLDFQVVESEYVFEEKTIQRMEILILSTLEWKMNPVTPYSFLDYLMSRLGLDHHICCEIIKRSETILLSTILDSRFTGYLPSVMAGATILHVINGLEPFIGDEYQNQLLRVPGIDEDKVEDCCELILELVARGNIPLSTKRKSVSMPGSPSGVIDVSFSSDSSNDSWAVASSVSSSPEPLLKKIRTAENQHSERFDHPSNFDHSSLVPW